MDSPVTILRRAAESTLIVDAQVPEKHPSAPVLGERRLGVGVAVEPRRVLTAHYLVLGASSVELSSIDGRPREVQKVELSHESGLALLSVDGPDLPAARVSGGEPVEPGLPVCLLTCGSQQERRGATGHVMAVGPFEAYWEWMLDRAIMTTIMNPGLAGAPLFDASARLVGLVTLGLGTVGRYSLAIPIELYLEERERWEAGTPPRRRAWLGLFPQEHGGALTITGLYPGSPAEKAGLARHDVILSLEGRPVSSLRELYEEIWKRGPGDVLGLQILRESATRRVEVVAGNRYDFFE